MKRTSPLLFAIAIAGQPPMAQELPKDVERLDAYSIDWNNPQYPETAKAYFAQGEVQVRQDFLDDGTPRGEASIFSSSNSPELDEKALELVRKARLQPSGKQAGSDAKKYVLVVSFNRDSITNIAKKTCAELIEDVGFHKSAHAGQPLTKMRLYEMTLGLFYFAGKRDVASTVKLAKSMPAAFDKTVEACGPNPAGLFLDQLREKLKQAE